MCVCLCVSEPTATPLPPAVCDSDAFSCDDGTCVDVSLRCDGNYDCLDGTDEVDCGASLYAGFVAFAI